MAFYKVGILSLLLLSGIFLLGIEVEYGNAQKMCLQVCDNEVAYMTCPSSGDEKITEVCVNCCTADEGSIVLPHLMSRLGDYEALHKQCGPHTELYNRSVELIKSGEYNGSADCNYLVWISFSGLEIEC
ncbi:hypothetical protein KY284_026810 [Solanum tuberosum]|nr:hypothetical protein KY284_026810 [Solanum tuberosum]